MNEHLDMNPLPWLLESDPENPGIRFYAMRDLLGNAETDPEVEKAKEEIMTQGPVPVILKAQHPDGYWVRPGGGYAPSYRATIWQIIYLAELGADRDNERVRRGYEYLMNHNIASDGGFSMSRKPIPSKVVHCLNGDPLAALLRLGYGNDPRVQAALDWQIRSISGKGEFRYYKSGTTGPGFACVANGQMPCAWGAVKALKALNAVPNDLRSKEVEEATDSCADFLLSRDPAEADYPSTERVSSSWFRFGFPLSYQCDVLESALALANQGYGDDPRLARVIQLILDKQDSQGRWKLERSLNGKTWVDIEKKGKPSKWITLRVMLLLSMASGSSS